MNKNWPNNIHGSFFLIYVIITKTFTKKLSLCVSYIFPKFESLGCKYNWVDPLGTTSRNGQ
jgi:hypothetical protein